MRNFRAELSFDDEKYWRDKVIITEKAVVKREKKQEEVEELKGTKECSGKCENLASPVKEMFDAVKAQELMIENLPEPLEVDEIEEKLESLKKFNQRLLDDENKGANEKDAKHESCVKGQRRNIRKDSPHVSQDTCQYMCT